MRLSVEQVLAASVGFLYDSETQAGT